MNDLTLTERADLDALEQVVNHGLQTFVEVGRALGEIRERKLYRQTHSTFEDYCRGKWEMSRSRAHRLIDAARTVEVLPTGNKPTSERQVRPLISIKDPERQRETWDRAVERAEKEGKPVSSRHVEEARAEATPKPDKPSNRKDLFVWRLQNLYREAPRRAQNAFRNWLETQDD